MCPHTRTNPHTHTLSLALL
uniref:Uncharacterized protein n=1 Tax=Anguilla anguilla TaxID=7936 RepID=A0A0E9TC62_ANGAN